MESPVRKRAKIGQTKARAAVAGLALAFFVIAGGAVAQAPSDNGELDLINAPIWSDPNTGIAMGGYDPISYFLGGKPAVGRPEYEMVWGGVAWWFQNEGNREAFAGAPEVYAPRFGGHGVVSMARDVFAPGKPEVWEIWEGQLYFFRSPVNREIWSRDKERITRKAMDVWKTHLENLKPELAIGDKKP